MAFPTLELVTTSGADNTEKMKSYDINNEDDFSPEQSKEPVGSNKTLWCSDVKSIVLISEFFSIEEHPLKQQGEVSIEKTTQNDDLMMKEFSDSGELTFENTNDNDDLMKTEAVESEYCIYHPECMICIEMEMRLADLRPGFFKLMIWHELRRQRLLEVEMRMAELQRQRLLERKKRLWTEFLGKDSLVNYPPAILRRRALPERHQLGDSNKTLSVPSRHTKWGDPLNPARNQILNSNKAETSGGILKPTHSMEYFLPWMYNVFYKTRGSNTEKKGDRKIEDNLLFTDQAEEKSQKTITKGKFNKNPMKSQFKDTNVINKLKDFFFLMREMTWILCVLIITSHVVVAETALEKTLSVPVSSDIELCGLTCEKSGMYTLDREVGVPILDYFCPEKSISFHDWNRERLQVNVSTGCCIIKNALKSDTGNYELMFQGTKKESWVQRTSCLVIDPISACIITTEYSDSGETYLRVSYSGEEATVLWTWNGEVLPERHQLSNSNKTLTVPSTDTGTFTVLISNPVSQTSTEYIIPSLESNARMEIGLCAAVPIVISVAIIALKGPARRKFEEMKQKNTANKNAETADILMSQDSLPSSKEKSDMIV